MTAISKEEVRRLAGLRYAYSTACKALFEAADDKNIKTEQQARESLRQFFEAAEHAAAAVGTTFDFEKGIAEYMRRKAFDEKRKQKKENE